MSDDARSTRVRGEPNPDAYKKAKTRYRSFNDAASTEYQRLFGINSKKTLTPNLNATEHAIFFWLSELRMQGTGRTAQCFSLFSTKYSMDL
jgi:hypothetical protein